MRRLLELNEVRVGDRAVITGRVPIGVLELQVSKATGARVLLLGMAADATRLELAHRLSADSMLSVKAADVLDEAIADAPGDEPGVAIEWAGAEPNASLLLRLVRKAGWYVQIGLYGRPATRDVDHVCCNDVRVGGSFSTTRSQQLRLLVLAGTGAGSLAAIVGATQSLVEWERAFEAVATRTPGKVLLVP